MAESGWEIVEVETRPDFKGQRLSREVWRRPCGIYKAVWVTPLSKVIRWGASIEAADQRAEKETIRQLGETISDEFRVTTMERTAEEARA